ncbi:recombinase family protein [Brevibacillus invocatus]|uniref:recombinase family protein n=1 Tax=Brevibacillus invocatus TaxID=173959 RepID=UPI001FE52AD4|nr:recombinase family protein [Brevibacillus invocatus]
MGKVTTKRLVGYVRISSDSQIENTSIAEQVKKIEAYCISQGWELAGIFMDWTKAKVEARKNGKAIWTWCNTYLNPNMRLTVSLSSRQTASTDG